MLSVQTQQSCSICAKCRHRRNRAAVSEKRNSALGNRAVYRADRRGLSEDNDRDEHDPRLVQAVADVLSLDYLDTSHRSTAAV